MLFLLEILLSDPKFKNGQLLRLKHIRRMPEQKSDYRKEQ